MIYKDFAEKHQITLRHYQIDANPNMPDFQGDHYKVVLKTPDTQDRGKKQLTIFYSKGYGHNGAPPTVDEVLCCLTLDSSYDGLNFEEWCDALGYNPDSRKAFDTYQTCAKQTAKFKKFLGADAFYEILDCEED